MKESTSFDPSIKSYCRIRFDPENPLYFLRNPFIKLKPLALHQISSKMHQIFFGALEPLCTCVGSLDKLFDNFLEI